MIRASTRLRQGVENPSPGKQTGGDGGREQGIGSESHSRGNTCGEYTPVRTLPAYGRRQLQRAGQRQPRTHRGRITGRGKQG